MSKTYSAVLAKSNKQIRDWIRKLFRKGLDYKEIHLPARGDSWEDIKQFAKQINGFAVAGSFQRAADIANRTDISDLNMQDLHVALFFEYRRYNHFGDDPDPEAMEAIYVKLDRMHQLQRKDQ
jgi:hypothetical protein